MSHLDSKAHILEPSRHESSPWMSVRWFLRTSQVVEASPNRMQTIPGTSKPGHRYAAFIVGILTVLLRRRVSAYQNSILDNSDCKEFRTLCELNRRPHFLFLTFASRLFLLRRPPNFWGSYGMTTHSMTHGNFSGTCSASHPTAPFLSTWLRLRHPFSCITPQTAWPLKTLVSTTLTAKHNLTRRCFNESPRNVSDYRSSAPAHLMTLPHRQRERERGPRNDVHYLTGPRIRMGAQRPFDESRANVVAGFAPHSFGTAGPVSRRRY
jgi:hypothetical protein